MIKTISQLQNEGYHIEKITLNLPHRTDGVIPEGFTLVNGIAFREIQENLTAKQWENLKLIK